MVAKIPNLRNHQATMRKLTGTKSVQLTMGLSQPLAGLVFLLLSGCLGKDYHTHTTVFEDGSLERTISTQGGDSALLTSNHFGVTAKRGWVTEFKAMPDSISEKRASVKFTRKFNSVQEANDALHADPEALFKIKSEFQTTTNWFYTYLTYSDTYEATMTFRNVKPDDFFTEEDYAFMNERRKKGVRTSSDSGKQRIFDEKFEDYIARGFFEDVFEITNNILMSRPSGVQWVDSTSKHKGEIFRYVTTHDFDASYFEKYLADTLRIPVLFSTEDLKRYRNLDQHFFALFDKFGHSIEMPYEIVDSNADSIVGTRYAVWKPQGNLVKAFTMQTKSRKTNHWSFLISFAVIFVVVMVARNFSRKTTR